MIVPPFPHTGTTSAEAIASLRARYAHSSAGRPENTQPTPQHMHRYSRTDTTRPFLSITTMQLLPRGRPTTYVHPSRGGSISNLSPCVIVASISAGATPSSFIMSCALPEYRRPLIRRGSDGLKSVCCTAPLGGSTVAEAGDRRRTQQPHARRPHLRHRHRQVLRADLDAHAGADRQQVPQLE